MDVFGCGNGIFDETMKMIEDVVKKKKRKKKKKQEGETREASLDQKGRKARRRLHREGKNTQQRKARVLELGPDTAL